MMTSISTTANWADLWDQIDAVASHTLKGIEHLEKFGLYLKERAVIEDEYAAKLRALAKRNLGKKKEDEEATKSFTFISSFYAMLRELESLAGQHEMISEQLRRDIYPAISHRCASLRAKRKNQLNELHTLNGTLNAAIDGMIKTHKYYTKAFKDAETAHVKYDKAEKNMDLSRAELERARNSATHKTQSCEEAKKNYAHALQTANNQQTLHYTELLPLALEKLREMDEERVRETQNIMKQSVEVETKVMAIIQSCYADMTKAANQVSPLHDSEAVVEQFRTGYTHPQPFPFEDFGSPSAILSGEGTSSVDTLKRPARNGTSARVTRKPSMGLFKGNAHVKKDGSVDYNSYPPQQRCRRLLREIENVEKEIEKNEQSCEGAQKMIQIYRDNPKMGNARDVEAELTVYRRKIDAITPQLEKLKAMLLEAQSELNMPISAVGLETPRSAPLPQSGLSTPSQTSPRQSAASMPASAVKQRSSYSEESLSSAGSFGMAAPISENLNGKQIQEKPPLRSGAPLAEKSQVYEEFDDVHILGTCKALYTFDGGSEGTMAMTEGEELVLVEKDEGDGWTRVRHAPSGREGFVPTTYLDCKWYPNQ